MKISYTRVAIDIFHYGHLRLLEQAKNSSDYTVCGLYSDELCLKWNGNLVMTYKEREAILLALKCVDEVMEQSVLDPTENLKKIYDRFPESKIILFKGHQEWVSMPGTSFIKSIGGKVIRPKYYSKITRSMIREKLNSSITSEQSDIESYILGDTSFFISGNSTKATTLASLKPKLKNSSIERLFIFTVSQWKNTPTEIINKIMNDFQGNIVVRSSTYAEDGMLNSCAGLFHSALGIDSQNSNQVKKAILKVIKSYSIQENSLENDQVLIQNQTSDVIMSGVVLTRNIQNNAPYYLINYDKSDVTDTVTSGFIGNKVEIIRDVIKKALLFPWKLLIESVQEIEKLLHNLSLDIEFAIKENGEVVIFQVRPLAAVQKFNKIPDDEIFLKSKIMLQQYKMHLQNSIIESHYTLSDMSFWNPAEIIGDRPDNLSYSIYKYLILHSAWNKGILPLGYKQINRDLMVRIGEKPYIEVETAFYSLMPNEIDDLLSKKIIRYYCKELRNNPELHDKIEFEIVHNCFTPTTDDSLKKLKSILDLKEYNHFRKSLVCLTQKIFDEYDNIIKEDLKSLNKLSFLRKKKIKEIKKFSINEKIKLVLELLDDVKELGSPQFARIARLAFIGNQYLKGLVVKEIISESDAELYLSSIETVASNMKNDFNRLISRKITKNKFNKLYGHLRPDTYDITKLPYNKSSEYLGSHLSGDYTSINKAVSLIDLNQIKKEIAKFTENYEISISADQLLDFIEKSIKQREYFKFEFTKNLSVALELLAEIGNEIGLDREKLSYLSIENIKGILPYSEVSEIIDSWEVQIEGRKKKELITRFIALPSIIFDQKDFEVVQAHIARPNFVTNLLVRGELIKLDMISSEDFNLISGKIVLLEKADPGYDWLFSKEIKGLITKFGGAASHMAIRCAEFGIPAAIGCGEIIYQSLINRKVIELDCINNKITTIR